MWPNSTALQHTSLRRAALVFIVRHIGGTDNCPVLIQSCRISSIRKQIFLAPDQISVEGHVTMLADKEQAVRGRFARPVWPQRGQHWLV